MGISRENVDVFTRWKNTAFANEKQLKKATQTIEKRRLQKKMCILSADVWRKLHPLRGGENQKC